MPWCFHCCFQLFEEVRSPVKLSDRNNRAIFVGKSIPGVYSFNAMDYTGDEIRYRELDER